MIDPAQFDNMIDWAFAIATAIYTTIGVTGYLMFGNNVSDEVGAHILLLMPKCTELSLLRSSARS